MGVLGSIIFKFTWKGCISALFMIRNPFYMISFIIWMLLDNNTELHNFSKMW